MLTEIPARRGAAVSLQAGQSLRVVNTHGGQVVDLWAFLAGSPEHMSMPHSVGASALGARCCAYASLVPSGDNVGRAPFAIFVRSPLVGSI